MSEEQIRDAIEISREQGWSELKEHSAYDGIAASSCHAQQNTHVIWEELKKSYPSVFQDFDEDELKLGRLIAEGGQAHIYEASLDGADYSQFVAQVFKMEGFSLADLQRQWPLAAKAPDVKSAHVRGFVLGGVVFGEIMAYCSLLYWGTFLKDGRFVFVMERCWGDLRTLINCKLSHNNSQGPPFSHPEAVKIMLNISYGMSELHKRGVLHRDLKAANVLIVVNESTDIISDPYYDRAYQCEVANFESAMLVQGIDFWRAPEVLEELQKKAWDRNGNIWTEKVDTYSFAMTCYEVLTGHVPFYGYVKSDWKKVIDGERPHLPDYIDPRVQKLVERCWHKEASNRPTFEIIKNELRELHSTAQVTVQQ